MSDSPLKSSGRILILILLAMNRRMASVELRALTGLGKGSLVNHLAKLETAGYVTTRNDRTLGVKRQTVEITSKGLEECRSLLNGLRDLEV